MKRSRFTESQIVGILKESDAGVPVNEIWRKHGISSRNGMDFGQDFELAARRRARRHQQKPP